MRGYHQLPAFVMRWCHRSAHCHVHMPVWSVFVRKTRSSGFRVCPLVSIIQIFLAQNVHLGSLCYVHACVTPTPGRCDAVVSQVCPSAHACVVRFCPKNQIIWVPCLSPCVDNSNFSGTKRPPRWPLLCPCVGDTNSRPL
jgi:hypothetical protein